MTKRRCPVCNEPIGRFFGHPKCESIAHVRGLDARGDVSAQRAKFLALPGWKATQAPTMRTINGIGTKLYWRRDVEQVTGGATMTLYVVLVFLPILPIRTYRVVESSNGYFFFLARRNAAGADWVPPGIVWWLALTGIVFALEIPWLGWVLLALGLIAAVDFARFRRRTARGRRSASAKRPA